MELQNIILFILIAVLIGLGGCGTAPMPRHSHLPKIIAIGDMHGDYTAYESLMRSAGLVDTHGDWAGGESIFVQTGDIPDRGPDTRKIIESLQKLEEQAPYSGGRVIPLVGNHEAMNMVGRLKYVHSGEFEAFVTGESKRLRDEKYNSVKSKVEKRYKEKQPVLPNKTIREKWNAENPLGKVEQQAAWSPDGYIGVWVSKNQLVTKIGNYLFAHGGFSQEYTQYTLDEMNEMGRKALLEQDWNKKSILRHKLGPLWYRGNVRGREKDKRFSRSEEISKVLQVYGATHIIVGHTRNEEGIRMSSKGRLIQIDTGASAHYGGVPSYLRIENGRIYAHTLNGFKKLH